jgi:two-component system alkaline phosphatase synthesis response regulator PhoP
LVIDDDAAFLKNLVIALEAEGFTALSASDGQQGLDLALKEQIDLIALDLVLPSISGIEICRKLREKKVQTPIIMISGKKKEEIDKVLGLELGADDYLLKPFGPREFLARIRAVMRRTKPEPPEPEEYSLGDVCIDFKKQIASRGKEELRLTAKEFGLLKLLILHEGEVVSRNMILNEVWGYDKFPTTRTVDTFVHNLRQKIEKDPANPRHLLTIPWSGYKLQK